MSRVRTARRPYVRKPSLPLCPAHRPVHDWLPINLNFYLDYREWLATSGYSPSALNGYGVAARLAFSLLDRPYWQIELEADLERVHAYIDGHGLSASTRRLYHYGVAKLADYLRVRCHRPKPARPVRWASYLTHLPAALVPQLEAFVAHRRRNWLPERHTECSTTLLSRVTRPLRWWASRGELPTLAELTPRHWYAYLDARLAEGVSARTLNTEFTALCGWLHWLSEQGEPVCARLFLIKRLHTRQGLPRDVPPAQLRQLLQSVERDAASAHRGVRRCGLMDRAWCLLMLHSGLRTQEIRRLRLSNIDWERATVRIERSKGLKDRLVPISAPAKAALQAYLAVRGPAEALGEQVFIYRHGPLSGSYCSQRLKWYGQRSQLKVTPHQLRHSCATLLLNAGAPVVTVQTILGHQHVDTTLGYARLYDGTLAADYYRAMASVEVLLALPEDQRAEVPSVGVLIALADALHNGALNEQQRETLGTLRTGLLQLAQREQKVT